MTACAAISAPVCRLRCCLRRLSAGARAQVSRRRRRLPLPPRDGSLDNAAALNGDTGRIMVAGDSAGGNLALPSLHYALETNSAPGSPARF